MDGPLPDLDEIEEDEWVEPVEHNRGEKDDGALKLLIEEPMPEMAAMIREFLLDCGIGSVVQSGPIGYPHRLPLSRARVFVREKDWAEARQLIDQFFRAP
ncbi:MAG: hypothetical protein FD129_3256 [bacterium]|nr:MAG: hypothetical protein FD129_3256 [bacterium]